MKTKNILVSFAFAAALCSCNVLDIQPTSDFSPEVVWGDSDAVDHYVYGFYAYMKNYCEVSSSNQSSYSDAYADVLKSGSWNQYNHGYNTTMMQESSFSAVGAGAFECWDDQYTYIRRCNEFFRDAPTYVSKYGEEKINAWTAEVRFIRALCYMRLMMVYGNDDPSFAKGGVPIRLEVQGPDKNDMPRCTWDEGWDVVLNDLQFAATYLPKDAPASGRLKKAAAYGMISRAALYAKRWERVVSAADSCALYGGELAADYKTVISTASCPENLIAVSFTSDGKMNHRADTFFRPIGDRSRHGNKDIYGVIGPTSELVDSYEMADGTPFDWTTFGDDPYTGREPRFYASIIYNGCKWEDRTIELYEGGEDAYDTFTCSNTTKSTPTGYYFRKFITEGESNWETNGSSHFAFFLRYAEVLLNKAEAQAELGHVEDACATLNLVRTRVNLPGRTDTDKDAFMAHLRSERMVELAGEGRRFWDLRRWKLAEDAINGQVVHGVQIKKEEDGSFTYTTVSVDADRTRIFPSRYYAFSIPESERNNNLALGENNPGW
ncbi:MAG: RagB/SusD family nutrient uptake outer membrane protein [Bacteroidales bacterium]|nr:RagB/SusD family nutrient uptake outer membrane protein [Bacteroidales bacterium]